MSDSLSELIPYLRMRAHEGDALAMRELSSVIRTTSLRIYPGTQDAREVEYWLEKSANLGDVESALLLGKECLSQDRIGSAKSWLTRAAGLGSLDAMYQLGLVSLKQNLHFLAQEWWYQAALERHLPSINKLAELAGWWKQHERSLEWAVFGRDSITLDIPLKLTPADIQSRENQNTINKQEPQLRLIRNPEDAEVVAAEWMVYMGFIDSAVTQKGQDGGIDVISTDAVAQVKMEGISTSRPVLQALHGAAMGVGRRGIFFSLSGYTKEAIEWGSSVDMALFQFDLQGEPKAVNKIAKSLLGS